MEDNTKELFKILIVDDSEFARKSMAAILEDANFNVIGEVSNAVDAINMVKSIEPNLVIIDVVMPDINGLDLAKNILNSVSNIQVIMTSSLNLEKIILESIALGAVDFLIKPFKKQTLLTSVEKLFRESLVREE
jgi:two-component system, chemotaxis family, chemotaxis protein CheY